MTIHLPMIIAIIALLGGYRMWRQGRAALTASHAYLTKAQDLMDSAVALSERTVCASRHIQEGILLFNYGAVDEAVELLEMHGFTVTRSKENRAERR